jgi:hypothetical protein
MKALRGEKSPDAPITLSSVRRGESLRSWRSGSELERVASGLVTSASAGKAAAVHAVEQDVKDKLAAPKEPAATSERKTT